MSEIQGLDDFERNVLLAEKEGVTHVAIDRHLARRLLDALKPAKTPLAVGDPVEVISRDSAYWGRTGTLVNIEPHAEKYPYSVAFKTHIGTGSLAFTAPIAYYAEADLKKVEL
jgi:hypothetical protein